MPKFKRSTKSQADLVASLQAAGWKEDQKARTEYRWYRLPYRWALYTLRGACELSRIDLQIQNAFRTMRRR